MSQRCSQRIARVHPSGSRNRLEIPGFDCRRHPLLIRHGLEFHRIVGRLTQQERRRRRAPLRSAAIRDRRIACSRRDFAERRRGDAMVRLSQAGVARYRAACPHCRAVGGTGCARRQGIIVPLHAGCSHARQIRHARSQCLACALRCGLLARRLNRNPGQFGRQPDIGSYRGTHRRLSRGQNGVVLRMASSTRFNGPIGRCS